MNTLQTVLNEGTEIDVFDYLESMYLENKKLSETEIKTLKAYETSNYAMLGLIGLLVHCKARILLGKKQTYYTKIQELCLKVPTNQTDLEIIADWDINRDLNEVEEYIWEKVMLEYPYEDLPED
jgi:hypothetical protein